MTIGTNMIGLITNPSLTYEYTNIVLSGMSSCLELVKTDGTGMKHIIRNT